MNFEGLKFLVVGSGFFGSVIAERIANDKNERVAVIEKRDHIGGNSFSEIDRSTGIECHKYGSHIFHTSNETVWKYINNFTGFNNYRHRVFTTYKDSVYSMPINLDTINRFYGKCMTPGEAMKFLEGEIAKDANDNPSNLEDKAISLVGKGLYEAFFKGYTAKQWETDPKKLPSYIITRLPMRFNYNADYFNDPRQGIPLGGYEAVFKALLSSQNIDVYLNTDFFSIKHLIPKDCLVIYTGPIDRYFEYKYGELGWRSLAFEKEVHSVGDYQGTAVMNYSDISVPYTRIHEFKHYHPERDYRTDATVLVKEFSKKMTLESEPYYPINTVADKEVLALYEAEREQLKNTIFGGRLGTYAYMDMDRVIAEALRVYKELIKPV
jgi:UDP-galactopyranose mutase